MDRDWLSLAFAIVVIAGALLFITVAQHRIEVALADKAKAEQMLDECTVQTSEVMGERDDLSHALTRLAEKAEHLREAYEACEARIDGHDDEGS